MRRLRAALVTLLDTITVALHRLLGALRGRATHILITGPDPLGMAAISEAVNASPKFTVHAGRAAETSQCFRRVVVTSSLEDLTDSTAVMTTVGRFRHVVVVAATADPRDMVCARDSRLPHQWPDGFDYRFLLGPDGTKSFTEPGVLPRFVGLDQWKAAPRVSVIAVAREQLHKQSEAALARAGQALPFSPRWVKKALSSVHVSLPPTVSWPASKESTKRVLHQVALAPEVEVRATALGYPALRSLTKARVPKITRGTIVAFHTPDDVYRAEAARLKRSLDSLGLSYQIFEVSAESDWVRTTHLKPVWMLSAREALAGPLLYVDVDAFFHADPWPYLSSLETDLAAVVIESGQLNSATVYIADTKGARRALTDWKTASESALRNGESTLRQVADDSDQKVLERVVVASERQAKSQFAFGRLPRNMAFIFDTQNVFLFGPILIEQLQVSRETTRHAKRLGRRRERLRQLEHGSTSSA